jgi:hypothetical protein
MDLFLTIISTILTLLMGYLGFHVSLNPASSPRIARIYRFSFMTMGVLLAFCVIFQATRNGASGQFIAKLLGDDHALLANQGKDIKNIRDSPPRVIIDRPASQNSNPKPLAANVYLEDTQSGHVTKTGQPLWVLPDYEIWVNSIYVARGPADAANVKLTGKILIVEDLKDPEIRKSIQEISSKIKNDKSQASSLIAGHGIKWFTIKSSIVKPEDISFLQTGKKIVVVLRVVTYRDPSGQHAIRSCSIMVPEPLGTLFPNVTWGDCGFFTENH